jgi:hypothetical protein
MVMTRAGEELAGAEGGSGQCRAAGAPAVGEQPADGCGQAHGQGIGQHGEACLDGNGRLVRIYLTERGRSVVQPMEDDIRAIGERATASLTPKQRRNLLAALAMVFDALQTEPQGDRELPGRLP